MPPWACWCKLQVAETLVALQLILDERLPILSSLSCKCIVTYKAVSTWLKSHTVWTGLGLPPDSGYDQSNLRRILTVRRSSRVPVNRFPLLVSS